MIVRYGGDEFLCGLTELGMAEAQRRFEMANARLDVTREAQVSVGLAELLPDETLDGLIARADGLMYAGRDTRAAE